MNTFSVTDAKAHHSELLNRAEKGEKIVIAPRGTPVVQLTPFVYAKPQIDFARLRAVRGATTATKTLADQQIRKMREAKC